MTAAERPAPPAGAAERVLGTYSRGHEGPTVVVCGGIHGNEPAGVHAAQRVLARLAAMAPPFAGTLVAVAGNVGALGQGRRFLQRDLNRLWLPAQVAALQTRPASSGDDASGWRDEDREQRQLAALFERYVREAHGPLVFLDLHTSSAASAPFVCTGDTAPNRRLARALPVPLILGLEECIDGAVLDWWNAQGHAALAIEGGQHAAASTVEHLQAALWLLLEACGALPRGAIDVRPWRSVLAQAARGLPRVVEVRHRHVVGAGDGFVMRPGFASFQRVRRRQPLAHDARGEVLAREGGRVLLPLYQSQGDDGFFLGRDVWPWWLHIGAVLRRLRCDRLLHLLPGVERRADDPEVLHVEPRTARWLVVEVFHLLGFRRRRERQGKLVFSRRFANAAARSLPWRAGTRA